MSLIWTHLSMFSHLPLFCVACKYKWIFGVMMGIVKSWKCNPFIFAIRSGYTLAYNSRSFFNLIFCTQLTQITSFWLNAFRSKKVLDPKRRDPSLNLKTLHIIIWVTDMYRWFDALKTQTRDQFIPARKHVQIHMLACKHIWRATKSPVIWPPLEEVNFLKLWSVWK